MPRYRRQVEPGSVQHVISRFVNRRFSFDDAGARHEYLDRVPAALARTDWRILAFALMSSHVHWVVKAGSSPSAAFFKPLHSGFASWLNRRTERLGPVFADRHRTIVCEGVTAAALVAYVHNNPVRAGVVDDPIDTDWTSHRAYLGLGPVPSWLDVGLGLAVCGYEPTPSGRQRFHALVLSRAADPRDSTLSGGHLEARRRAARAVCANPVELEAPSVRPVGSTVALDARVIVPPDCPERPAWRGGPIDIIVHVASVTGVSSELLRSRTRVRAVTSARRLALLLWCNALSRPRVDMARALGLSASSACGLVDRASSDEHARAAALAQQLRVESRPSVDKHEKANTVP